LALGAVAPTPFRAFGVEQVLEGREFNHALLAEAGEEIMREVQPISDARASAEFRQELSRVIGGRALEECGVQAGCGL
jgi:carbon-monoxide dehydrogenase medium subunit